MSTTAPSSAKSITGVLDEEPANLLNGLSITESGPAVSEIAISPRVSTIGIDEIMMKKDQQPFTHDVGPDYTAPGLDSLHWAGVKKRGDFDQRSIASSMAAERDDKSIYEEPAVGAVEENDEDHNDDEPPEEIILPDVSNTLESMSLQPSLAGSDGKPESITGAHSQSSPRDMQQHFIPPPATTSSQATSLDAEKGSIHIPSASIDGDAASIEDDIPQDTMVPRAPSSGKFSIQSGQNIAPGSSAAPSSTAASPRSPGIPQSPLSRSSIDFESHLHDTHPATTTAHRSSTTLSTESPSHKQATSHHQGVYSSSLMRDVTGMHNDDDREYGDRYGSSMTSTNDGIDSYAGSITATMERESVVTGVTGAGINTNTNDDDDDGNNMQSINIDDDDTNDNNTKNEDEDGSNVDDNTNNDKTTTNTNTNNNDDDDDNDDAAVKVSLPVSTNENTTPIPPVGVAVEPLEVEAPIPPSSPSNNTTTNTINTTNTNTTTTTQPASIPRVDLGPEWENTFKGLLFTDGVDALGRPVVVLNADAVPPRMKASALTYVKAHLEPMVNAGDYVIVFTARKAKLPSLWIMGAYQSLPRPYRKNVQYVILVRPSAFLRAVLNFMRPFVSKKAGRKIKLVDSLEEIGEATGGEVTMSHLGASFIEDEERAAEEEAARQAAGAP